MFQRGGQRFQQFVYVQEGHTHRPEKTISKNKNNSEENCTNIPWKNQSGEKHNQQKAHLLKPWNAKLEELKKPCKSHEKITEQGKFPLQKKYK